MGASDRNVRAKAAVCVCVFVRVCVCFFIYTVTVRWVPRPRWTPKQRLHKKTPNVVDAKRGLRSAQSAHALLAGLHISVFNRFIATPPDGIILAAEPAASPAALMPAYAACLAW